MSDEVGPYIGRDRHGIHHACYRVRFDGKAVSAWCSLIECDIVAPETAVDCMFCLSDVYNMDDEDEPEPDDELDPYSPDEADR